MPGQLSQHNHAADPQGAAVDGWHELSVANPTFLLERLGSECTDLQALRELTVHRLDAIKFQDPDLEDQAARYHPGRHVLTINDDVAISDLIAHWQVR